jgi:hypothetical protein
MQRLSAEFLMDASLGWHDAVGSWTYPRPLFSFL